MSKTGARIRTNNVFGTLTDNPLLVGATTMNSAALANLAAVSSNHAIIVIDPLRSAGAPEIVIVTAHTAAATSATITRGADGSTARQHASGVLWVHAPTTEDAIQILTSSTRPSDPYRGQLIFETDTNSLVGRDTSDAWQTIVPFGAWSTWSPTLANITVGNGTTVATYARIGRTIHFRFKFTLGTTSAIGSSPTISLPVALHANYANGEDLVGLARYGDTGVAGYSGTLRAASSTTALFIVHNAAGTYSAEAALTSTAPFTWGSTDLLSAMGTYEAAS